MVANRQHHLPSDLPRTKLDSHADTCCTGRNATVLYSHKRTMNVSPFLDSLGTANSVPIVSAAIAYDDEITAKTYILIIHQALYFGDMLEHNLLSPFQCQLQGVGINECPRILEGDAVSDHSHSILFPNDELKIPLCLNGIVSYFSSRRPTKAEFNQCHHLELTAAEPEWNPHNGDYSKGEASMTGDDGNILRRMRPNVQAQEIMGTWTTEIMAKPDDPILEHLEQTIKVGSKQSSLRANKMMLAQLADRWNIGLDKAKKTLDVTAQRGTRTVAFPSLEARFRTNDCQMRYCRLNTALYTDTMFPSITSQRGNTCTQIYVNNLEWCRAYPLRTKGDAHTSLDLLFPEEGVPNTMISDNTPELHAGEFHRECRQAGAYCKEMEPYSPWSNRAEGTIRELKRATRRAMLKTQSPKRLWDYCIELQAKIWSNTAHDIPTLGGQTPKTVMRGETANISALCEYDWVEWLHYRDTESLYPEDTKVLVRYMGLSKSIGLEMCCHVLKANGSVLQRSTVGRLTPSEMESDVVKRQMANFITAIHTSPLGPVSTSGDFEGDNDSDMPSFKPYGDNSGNEPRMPEADVFTVDAYDKYIGAQLRMPLRDSRAEATVVTRMKDAEGNPFRGLKLQPASGHAGLRSCLQGWHNCGIRGESHCNGHVCSSRQQGPKPSNPR